MILQLFNGEDIFLPSIYGKRKNYSYRPNSEELEIIKQEAFIGKEKFTWLIDKVLRTTFTAGICTGLSIYVLGSYLAEETLGDLNTDLAIAVFQARTWGGFFVRQSIKSYFQSQLYLLQELKQGMVNNTLDGYPLLVILPKISKILNINYAHTLLPYEYQEGLSQTTIKVYDSNYPFNDEMYFTIDRISGRWSYKDKNSDDWRLTINYTGNLTKKVAFLF